MRTLELFGCSGGMAEGFRQAGVVFDLTIDKDPDACESYRRNLGHRPVQMDAKDLLRLVRLGLRPPAMRSIRCSDPQCGDSTWDHACDESAEPNLVLLVADPPCTPWSNAGKRRGLADERDALMETCGLIEALRPYCWLVANVPGLDDATNWPVVQKTMGAIHGYHVDYASLDAASYGVAQHRVRPFFFGHPVGTPCLSWPEATHGDPQHGSSYALPGVETLKPFVTVREALSGLAEHEIGRPVRLRWRNSEGAGTKPRASHVDEPAGVVTTRENGDGNTVMFSKGPNPHRPGDPERPARTITRNPMSDGAIVGIRERVTSKRKTGGPHGLGKADEPAPTIRSGGCGHSAPETIVQDVLTGADPDRGWDNHPVSRLDDPSRTIKTNGGRASGGGLIVLVNERHPPSELDSPSATLGAKEQGGQIVEWPWNRPATVVTTDERIGPPGHSEGSYLSTANAVVLSEKAAARLQGFPDSWHFEGKTKRARWSQLGQAMPPPLALPVARQIVAWVRARGIRL